MSNIDDFNFCAAKILDYLYKEFPIEATVEITDFPEYEQSDKSELFYATVEYLNNEGFIKYSFSQYGGYSNVILTAQGLFVLNSRQDPSEENGMSLGGKLGVSLKANCANEINEIMQELFRLFIEL